MKLVRFSLTGFRSYVEEQVLELAPHVTLLAGQNNVGKSTALHALRSPVKFPEDAGASFSAQWSFELEHDEQAAIRSHFAPHPSRVLQAFAKPTPDEPVVLSASRNRSLTGLGFTTLELPRLKASAETNGMGWRSADATESDVLGHVADLAMTAAARQVYLGPRKVDQGPRHLLPEQTLQSDAANLTNVLFDLQLNQLDETFERLLEFMHVAVPGLTSIQVRTQRDQTVSTVQGEPYIRFGRGRETLPLRHCGTGVEQLLAFAVAVLTSPEPRLMLIDEPQAYLHPRAERAMLALIDERSEHQYVIASHSNVLLHSRPIGQARLITLADGRSRITDVASTSMLLDELDVTAADLWLPDAILWVEGATEEAVLGLLAEQSLTHAQRSTLVIRRMPVAASKFASKKQADATYRFCEDVSGAVAPLTLRMRFLLDRDEQRSADIDQIVEASGGRVTVLPVRELENLFLDARLLFPALADLPTTDDDAAALSYEAVSEFLESLLARHDDRQLFPRPPQDSVQARTTVRASRLLAEIWWHFARAEYDKVADGLRLAVIAEERAPETLRPLRDLLMAVVSTPSADG
jgi:predicted ATPase